MEDDYVIDSAVYRLGYRGPRIVNWLKQGVLVTIPNEKWFIEWPVMDDDVKPDHVVTIE